MSIELHEPRPKSIVDIPLEDHDLNAFVQTPHGSEEIFKKLSQLPLSGDQKSRLLEYALVVMQAERNKKKEVDIKREGYTMHLLPGVQQEIPEDFIEQTFAFALEHGKILKHAALSEKGEPVNEIVWKFPGTDPDKSFVLKLTQASKMPTPDHELRILQRANMLGLPAPRPLGMIQMGEYEFLMMEYVDGSSGMDIWKKLEQEGWSEEEVAQAQKDVDQRMKHLAADFRSEMFIDKPWYIKDCLLTFDGHHIRDVFPLDFERAHPFDPMHPDKIRSAPKRQIQ